VEMLRFLTRREPTPRALRRYALTQRWDSQHLRTTCRLLSPQRGTRILEVGSGRGHLTSRLDDLGAIATGIDVNPEAAQHAIARDIRCMQVEKIDFPDGVFDQVVAVHAIEHFPVLEVAFAEMARVLRPGGRMLLIYPYEPIRGLGAVPDAITIYRNPFRAREMHRHKLRPARVQGLGEGVGLEHLHTEFRFVLPQFATVLGKPA
jgi:SAM-dependent methyltransferase